MKLSLKASRFVMEALEHYQHYHDEQLQREGLSEDEVSDLTNDRQYIEALKQDFANYQKELLRQPTSVRAEA